jgi:hypothetical protein
MNDVSCFRIEQRLPQLCYFHPENGAALLTGTYYGKKCTRKNVAHKTQRQTFESVERPPIGPQAFETALGASNRNNNDVMTFNLLQTMIPSSPDELARTIVTPTNEDVSLFNLCFRCCSSVQYG